MRPTRALGPVLCAGAVCASLLIAGCASPPDKEMQQAQGAIDAAKAAGADAYAPGAIAGAIEALRLADDAVAAGDYRLALNHALDSREQAQTAAREAAEGRAVARVEADHAVMRLSDALAEAERRFASRLPPNGSTALREAMTVAEAHLQEAHAAMTDGDYQGAAQTASAAADALERTVP